MGHDFGNRYIIKLYDVLELFFPRSMVFRIGGDEFVVIVKPPDTENVADTVDALKKYLQTLMHNSSLAPWERVSAAVGFARYDPKRHKNADDVFRDADAAMYENKKTMHAGRE